MKNIIYVEDDPDTADTCKTILEVAGYKVDTANTGKAAVTKIKKGNYNLALIDIMLPDMSGWDVYQKVKSVKTKFAFLSAMDVTPERLAELKKAGVADYITKPFTKKDLTNRVKKILSKK